MRQSGDSAFRSRITLRLRLAHPITARRDVHNRSSRRKVRRKKLCQIKRCSDADRKRIVEIFITAIINSLHQRKRIVHQNINMPKLLNDELGEFFKDIFFRKIPDKTGIFPNVNVRDLRAFLFKFIYDGRSDSMSTTSHNDIFILERFHGENIRTFKTTAQKYTKVYIFNAYD